MYYLTLQFIPRYVRGAMFMIGAVGLIVFSICKLNQSLLSVLAPNRDTTESLVNTIYTQRFLRRGPKIVAIGGGTGLSTLLRGLKEYTTNLTAIVTVADDGGSSGVLRRELGVLPPGDVRNCIAALADAEPLVTKLFQYRFEEGDGLAGHSFGNLFIVAMSGVVGNFEDAIRQTSRVLAVRGQIIPSTLDDVTLCARRLTRGRSRGSPTSAPRSATATTFPHPRGVPGARKPAGPPGGRAGHPGRGPDHPRPRQPVHERSAEPAGAGHQAQPCRVARAQDLRLQCRDSARRDRRFQRQRTTSAAIEDHIGKGVIHYVLANDNIADVHPQGRAIEARPRGHPH